MVKKLTITILFIFCFVAQVLPVIKSGTSIGAGIGFWGPNGHDGVWHLALINQISNPFVINMPIFSGEVLKNYHPFFDVLISYVSKITSITPTLLLFQLFPIISTFIYLWLSYQIGKLLTKSSTGGLILMLLNTIKNSFGWVINFFRNHNFEGESLFWAMQSPSNQLNPPYILSIILILSLVYILLSNPIKLSETKLISVSIILILLPIIKAYSAIPAYIIFVLYIMHSKKYLKVFIGSIIIAIILFLQFNKHSSGLLIWQPFWFIKSLFESTDKLYFARFAQLASSNIPKQIIFYCIGLPVFIIGNFAFRLFGIKELFTKTWFYKSLLLSIVVLTTIPLFFIQSGTSWNTIQFLYYAIFLMNIPLTILLTKSNIIYCILIISIQLPALFASFPQYLGKNPPTYISNSELNCLNYLKKQPKSIILTYPYDPYIIDKSITPIPLYAYATTSYVSAFTSQFTYLEDEMNLSNSGYDWQSRRHNSEIFFRQENEFQDRGFLLNNKIDYIYLTGEQLYKTKLNIDKLYIKNIYQNDSCQIYKVIK